MIATPRDTSEPLLPDDPRLLEAVRDYQAEWERGRQPRRKEYLDRLPELAPALEQCFDGLDLVHGVRPFLPPTTAPGAGGWDESQLRPEQPLGDFRIEREIGRGGMGIVYEAVQLSLGRRVALKVLPFAAAFDSKNLQRFKNESQAAAQLHHSNIVPVYAVGVERGMHYYAMQLIEGQSVAVLIDAWRSKSGKPASQLRSTSALTSAISQPDTRSREMFRSIARLGVQAALALDHAHEFGIIHRDIKPANLLVDVRGNLWITDFGLAQFRDNIQVTGTGEMVGTLRYMSPEQAEGRRVLIDHRADIYSLGATLYELLALEPIFDAVTRSGLLAQILTDEPCSPRVWNRAIPVELETIVLKAVSKNPAERYASARQLADDLQRFLDDKPIQARRPSLWERWRKWARRHPSVVWAGAIVLVLLFAGLIVNNLMVERERAQTKIAYQQEKQRAQEAEDRFQQAKRSVDFIIQFCEEELADKPNMLGMRRKLLDFALVYYQDFLKQRHGDPQAQAELAVTKDRVRSILAELELLQGVQRLLLVNEEPVQKDINLTADQRQRLEKLSRAWPDGDFPFGGPSKAAPEERHKKFIEWAGERDKAIRLVMNGDQLNRLGQIALQRKGTGAFNETEVIERLKLTRAQRDKIRDAVPPFFPMPKDKPPRGDKGAFPGDKGPPPGDKGPNWDKGLLKGFPGPNFFEQWSKEAMERVLAILTNEQRAEWERMIGPPGPPPSFRGPGKGPPRAGGDGPG